MSANAPACSASKNPGTAHAVCTSPTSVGDSVRVVIVQPAAAMCMNVPTFETNPAIQSALKTRIFSGDQGLDMRHNIPMPADEDLVTSRGLVVPFAALNWTFARSTGAGGQHINKTSSKSTLSFIVESVIGPSVSVARIRSALPKEVRITVQKSRSQWRNRQLCMAQLCDMLDTAAMPPAPPRRKSRPTRGSIERRLESKRAESKKKESRRTDNW
ncbi:MAG: aminoacyl-tRNA hydrolase [Actinobacteria bacterium]|nr:MAG: aminoacyl-tRNA hydrolase [Actinomycetota bacterium]